MVGARTRRAGSGGRYAGSSPVISTPSRGHEHLPEVCRIHSASSRLMTCSRLHLLGPTRSDCRILINLLPIQDVKGGLGQVSGHGADGLAMTLAFAQVPVEAADMALRASKVIDRHRIGGLGKGPLQVTVHV